jgi:HPt (histidine-containing phosphotransfer) domain-containing protein
VIYQEIPLVDKNRIEELRSMDDDGSFIAEIIDLFVSDSETSINELRSLIGASELDQTRKTAHRLKGSALSIGANRFAALASDIEHDNDPASIRISLGRLEQLRSETIAELSSYSS